MSQKAVEELLQPLLKDADCLILSASEQAIDACVQSKFGGLPYAEKEEVWACCPSCDKELIFIAQLYHPQQQALACFFYCFHCFPWGLGNEETGQWLVRYYSTPEMTKYVAPKRIQSQSPKNEDSSKLPSALKTLLEHLPSLKRKIPLVIPCLCETQQIKSLPDWDDLEGLSPKLVQLYEELNKDDPWETYYEIGTKVGHLDDYGTLIGGYPCWVQGSISPKCKQCSEDMEFFAQIDSESAADLMWGDAGLVYLFQCPQHRTEFTLELQCS